MERQWFGVLAWYTVGNQRSFVLTHKTISETDIDIADILTATNNGPVIVEVQNGKNKERVFSDWAKDVLKKIEDNFGGKIKKYYTPHGELHFDSYDNCAKAAKFLSKL